MAMKAAQLMLSLDFDKLSREQAWFNEMKPKRDDADVLLWRLSLPGGDGTPWAGLRYAVEVRFHRRQVWAFLA